MNHKIVAVLAAGLLLTGCTPAPADQGAATSPTPAPSQTETVTPTPTPTPDGSAAHPFEFGVYALSDDGSMWAVTITEVVTDGTSVVRAENQFNEVRDGWQYVLGVMSSVVTEDLLPENQGLPVTPTSVMPILVGADGKVYTIWNDDSSAVVLNGAWVSQPDIIANVGVESTGRFAIQVPTSAVAGGQLGTRNEVSGTIVYFGAPLE